MDQKGQRETLMSPGNGSKGATVFLRWGASKTTIITLNYAALPELKGNLLEDICDPERSMAGQIPLRDTYSIGPLLARHSKKSHHRPIPPEDETANLSS